MEIKVYGSEECPYCRKLKKYLKVLRIPFNYVDIDQKENEKEYIEVINKVGHQMIPVIRVDEDFMSPDKEFTTIEGAIKTLFGKYYKREKK
jgi:glutaredoxin